MLRKSLAALDARQAGLTQMAFAATQSKKANKAFAEVIKRMSNGEQ